jgi:Domain of unknown function (DUF4293)
MWQRKQTLYSILAIICMVATKFLPFAVQSKIDDLGKAVLVDHGANASIPIVLCIATVVALAGASVVLFKKRNIQKLLCLSASVVALIASVLQYLFANSTAETKLSFGIALPLIACLLCLMAYRGVVADEKLIKSLDRLRD